MHSVYIKYTNWKGETAIRHIEPINIWQGVTEYHQEQQWFLNAFDLDKQANRNFAMKDITLWSETEIFI